MNRLQSIVVHYNDVLHLYSDQSMNRLQSIVVHYNDVLHLYCDHSVNSPQNSVVYYIDDHTTTVIYYTGNVVN